MALPAMLASNLFVPVRNASINGRDLATIGRRGAFSAMR
jgi:hypothetical protein